jgi:hypothetical protein
MDPWQNPWIVKNFGVEGKKKHGKAKNKKRIKKGGIYSNSFTWIGILKEGTRTREETRNIFFYLRYQGTDREGRPGILFFSNSVPRIGIHKWTSKHRTESTVSDKRSPYRSYGWYTRAA